MITGRRKEILQTVQNRRVKTRYLLQRQVPKATLEGAQENLCLYCTKQGSFQQENKQIHDGTYCLQRRLRQNIELQGYR